MIQQLLRLPRIFACDPIYRPQHTQCPQRDVFQVPNRRADDIQPGRQPLVSAHEPKV
jgi:hypothetical protein